MGHSHETAIQCSIYWCVFASARVLAVQSCASCVHRSLEYSSLERTTSVSLTWQLRLVPDMVFGVMEAGVSPGCVDRTDEHKRFPSPL